MRCHIEMYIDGLWRLAAGFEPTQGQLDRGTEGGGQLEYDPDFALEFLDDARYALAPQFPVNFDLHTLPHWPPFLLDLLPGGHARRRWVKRLNVRDGPAADYPLLVRAGGNPPGNLRIRQAAPQPGHAGPGFAKEEIARREDTFIEYAEASGALVSGATSVQGEAPKFLLVEDRQGRFHPDGALPDAEAAVFWLVKYPRGRTREDEVILRNEAAYYNVARAFGLRVGKPLEYLSTARGALFIPRFDRTVTAAGVERWGMWSLAALSGSFRFGERRTHEEYCRAIGKVSSAPRADLLEYLQRDILNVALGNTDNHGRNTVLLKGPGHRVEVAPLFDFAPMFFDPEGIPRATRWEFERPGGVMDWRRAAEVVSAIAGEDLSGDLEGVAAVVANLEELLEQAGVEPEIRERCRPRIEGVLTGLGGLS
jgi:serine/threonine-protein kinase HipA